MAPGNEAFDSYDFRRPGSCAFYQQPQPIGSAAMLVSHGSAQGPAHLLCLASGEVLALPPMEASPVEGRGHHRATELLSSACRPDVLTGYV